MKKFFNKFLIQKNSGEFQTLNFSATAHPFYLHKVKFFNEHLLEVNYKLLCARSHDSLKFYNCKSYKSSPGFVTNYRKKISTNDEEIYETAFNQIETFIKIRVVGEGEEQY